MEQPPKALLTERRKLSVEYDKLRKELQGLDDYLMSRYGWIPYTNVNGIPLSSTGTARKKAAANPIVYTGDDVRPTLSEGIQYAREALEWETTLRPEAIVSVRDFRDWLRSKYGDAVNDASLKGPLRSLTENGKLVEVLKGEGRRPTTYKTGRIF